MSRAILIDPDTRTITTIDMKTDLQGMYDTLTRPGFDKVDDINRIGLTQRYDLWVDGEGLLKPDIPVFRFEGYPHPLAGRGLVLGHDGEGETIGIEDDAQMRMLLEAFLPGRVRWTNQFTTGKLTPTREEGNRIIIGDGILKAPTNRGGQA